MRVLRKSKKQINLPMPKMSFNYPMMFDKIRESVPVAGRPTILVQAKSLGVYLGVSGIF